MGNDKKSKHKRNRSDSRSRSRSRDRDRSQKGDRKRRNSSSSGSESSDEEKLQRKLDTERKQRKHEKKQKKEKQKSKETDEEKKARRMEKRMKKEGKREAKAQEGAIPSELSYTNINNPFNDSKLTDTFVWGKKLQQEGKSHLSTKQIEKEARKRIEQNLREAQEFKRVRDARMAAREDADMMQRDADRSQTGRWDSKERQFQMDQVKERTRIRIEQNRAKSIDLLSRYIRFADPPSEDEKKNDAEFELEDPMSYIKNLTVDDYEDLIEDIKVYRTLEADRNSVYWDDIVTLVEEEMSKKRDSRDRESIHGSVKQEVSQLFKGKSIDELCTLETQIRGKLRTNSGNQGYWQGLLDQLKVHIARSRLRETHGKMLRLKLARIREEQMKEVNAMGGGSSKRERGLEERNRDVVKKEETEPEEEEEDEDDQEKLSKRVRRKVDIKELDDPDLDDVQREHKWRALTDEQLETATLELYEMGCYSPTYNGFDDTMPGIEIINAQEDVENLMERREKNRKKPEGVKDEAEAKMIGIARKGMEGDEATFSVEEQLETQKHLWSDKYRPRKPTYLNRVQTGFDWNKYNQTHYDMDNPPPKIVQGYKFNIFYPDLLDKTKTPTFTVTPCDDQDFAVVRFKAGPPYEDIAFKVVNREWEILHKNGYKCQFQNGVFQLWYVFKKYRYRR